MHFKKIYNNPVTWSAVDKISSLLIKFVVQTILARLIAPEEFGLIAMVIVLTTVGIAIMDSGLTQSVIQSKSLSSESKNSIFTLNLVLGILLTYTCYLVAPLVAGFYGQSDLKEIIRGISMVILFTAMGRISYSWMNRNLQFRLIAMIAIPANLFSGGIAIAAAYHYPSVWVLVGYHLLLSGMLSVGYTIAARSSLSISFSRQAIQPHIGFSFQMLGVRVLKVFSENFIYIVIGKIYAPEIVAFVQRNKSFTRLTSELPFSILDRVAFPRLSRCQDNNRKFKHLSLKYLLLYSFIFATGLAAMTSNFEFIIHLLLGAAWIETAKYIVPVSISAYFLVVAQFLTTILKSRRFSGKLLLVRTSQSLVTLVALIFASRGDIMTVLWTFAAIQALLFLTLCVMVVSVNQFNVRKTAFVCLLPIAYGVLLHECMRIWM